MKKLYILLLVAFSLNQTYAQVDTTAEEEIDFSAYADADLAGGVKRYCTSKVYDLSPNKLISIGYDYQSAFKLTNNGFSTTEYTKDTSSSNINGMGGIRIGANIPVISKTSMIWSVGGSFWRMKYNFEDADKDNYVTDALNQRGLTTVGLNSTLFKPLNEKNFILGFISADVNGDFTLGDDKLGDYLTNPKITVAALYGSKKSDYSMLAFGLSRTYRAGSQTLFPLILWNHTFANRKWGVEALFPSRLNIRRNFNPRTLLFLGYELEGNSYAMVNRTGNAAYNNFELRRSEIRPRITFEKSLSGFIWLSVQAGYRMNYRFDIDNGDFFRLLGDKTPYTQTNTLTNPFYFNISLNLVSP